MKMSPELRETILLLRYHTTEVKAVAAVFTSYADIVRLCKVPYSSVRRLCLRFLNKK